MPKVSDIFPSAFLRHNDLSGATDALILGWREEYAFGTSFYVLDLDLKGARCVLRLSGVTIGRDIEAALGEGELDKWPGRTVSLYPTTMKIRDKDGGEDKVIDLICAMASPADVKPPPGAAVPSIRRDKSDDILF